jgi:RNA polymerase sigma-70 factor (ECF subfamily)
VREAQNGDDTALSWLYGQYAKAMFNICFRMTGNKNDAEDVLQDSFLIAFKNLSQLKEVKQFGGWLRRIVVNECIRYCKKSLLWKNQEEQEYKEEYNNITDDETEWWKEVSLASIHQSIKTLPDGCRQVFNLYALEDYSHKQIAESLGISENTSKSQYHRARQLLKERIVKQLQINGQF